jgi:23S rRNA pseudouridine2605 synthase
LGKDNIEADHHRIAGATKLYWMLNKPRGVVTTTEDERGRETVYALLPKNLPWMGPVGRLDKASEGLLLFTNDSEWSAKITGPESHLDKTYHVQLAAIADASLCELLMTGVNAGDVELLRATTARLVRTGAKNSWIEIVLHEGKNRQIRRMLEASGVEVLRLIRVAIGPLELGVLGKGQARELTKEEKLRLDGALRAASKRRGI